MQRSPLIDYTIIALLLLNLAVTVYLAVRPAAPTAQTSTKAEYKADIADAAAMALANEVVPFYNSRDTAGLYARFDPIAKAQVSQDQLDKQLVQLFPIMGSISDTAFVSAALAGREGDREFFQLNYKVRLTGGAFQSGELRLTVVRREGKLSLVGFFVNGVSR
jgi:hypothetical protein